MPSTRSNRPHYFQTRWQNILSDASRSIIDAQGNYHPPRAMCILDDCSRLCCHIQWYLDETADSLIHALTQAIQKRGLPRSLMTDNGAAMIAGETKNGLGRFGLEHETTLPYSPYHYVAPIRNIAVDKRFRKKLRHIKIQWIIDFLINLKKRRSIMFENLFKRPTALERHRKGPFLRPESYSSSNVQIKDTLIQC